MEKVVFNTNGGGYWSEVAKSVTITDMQIGYVDDELTSKGDATFGELRIYFDTKTWDVYKDGLIYTDRQFEREMREFLTAQGLVGSDVSYSEQGMQGDDFVSCDVGEKFLKSWAKKFNINWAQVIQRQNDEFNARWGVNI